MRAAAVIIETQADLEAIFGKERGAKLRKIMGRVEITADRAMRERDGQEDAAKCLEWWDTLERGDTKDIVATMLVMCGAA